MLRARALLVPAAIAAAVCCDDGDARFTARFASDFAPERHVVSVLGVYKDGRMTSDGWDAIAARVSPALGAATVCEAGYDDAVATSPALADAIDEYARADGPTDDLLAQLAPAAKGDLVLVLTIAGKLPRRTADAGAGQPASSPPMAGRGGRGAMHGGGRGSARQGPQPAREADVLDVSASFFSVQQRRSVAMLSMQYSGASVDDAIAQLAARLARTFPDATCAGWRWDGKVDPERVRASIDQ